jgi:anaerobic magnesium-protoporphyrin IX monomethyl ester cyclase
VTIPIVTAGGKPATGDAIDGSPASGNASEILASPMKVLFICPYIPLERFYGKYAKFGAVLPPYGMACVASYLRKNGADVTLMDANRACTSVAEVTAAAKNAAPDIVGLYATTLGYSEAQELVRALKVALPASTRYILGGPHAIGERGDVLRKNSDFDFSCLGEGEVCMLQLTAALSAGKTDLSDITALVWRRDGAIVENPVYKLIDVDDVPTPFAELGTLDNYRQKAFAYRKTPFAMVQTVRGCPFKCVFCSSPNYLTTIQGGKLRAHSMPWIERQLDYLVYERGVREVYFVDDTFNWRKSRVFEICALIEKKYPGLAWSCNFEVAHASREMLAAMQRAGCWSIMIGAESGSQEILNRIQKKIKVEQIVQAADWCHELGLMGRASFILGHPGETPETLQQTMDLARRVRLPFVTFSLMTPFAGTRMFDIAADTGNWTYESEKTTLSKITFVPFGISKELLEKTYRNAYRMVYGDLMRNLMLLRYLKSWANWDFLLRTVVRFFKPAPSPRVSSPVTAERFTLSGALQEKL